MDHYRNYDKRFESFIRADHIKEYPGKEKALQYFFTAIEFVILIEWFSLNVLLAEAVLSTADLVPPVLSLV